MVDRGKVIKAWESVLSRDPLDVPWDLIDDTLILLKAQDVQEAQLVLNIGEQIFCKSGSCPKRGNMLNTTCNKRYCGDCGQAVKWDG